MTELKSFITDVNLKGYEQEVEVCYKTDALDYAEQYAKEQQLKLLKEFEEKVGYWIDGYYDDCFKVFIKKKEKELQVKS